MFRSTVVLLSATVALIVLTGCSSSSLPWTPVQAALWHPAQLADEDADVYGLRLSLGYGKNNQVYGIDAAGLASTAMEDSAAIQVAGIANMCESNFAGLQASSFYNGVEGDLLGIQTAFFFSIADTMTGIQIGIPPFGGVAVNGRADGIQIASGAAIAGKIRGIQIAGFAGIGAVDGIQVAGITNGMRYGMGGRNAHGNFVSSRHGGGDFQNLRGIQLAGAFNGSEDVLGLQGCLVSNRARNLNGIQMSLFNNTREHSNGLQLGLINYSETMTGIQLGLINIIRVGRLPFILPFINIGFGKDD